MKRNPLLLVLLILVAAIAAGDCVWPYGLWRSAPEWPGQNATWQGVVTRQPRQSAAVQQCVVRLDGGDNRLVTLTLLADSAAADGGTAGPLADSAAATPRTTLKVGDLVAFNARITLPHNAGNPGEMDYAAYLRHQGIVGQAFCGARQWIDLGRASSLRLHERMLCLRERFTALFAAYLDGDALAIVNAMTLGDRARVDTSLRQLYSRSGVSHVLALSGLHISILFLVFALAVMPLGAVWGRAGERAGTVLAVVMLWLFVFIAGLPLSLVRAATMMTIATLLQLLNRRASAWHVMVLTLIVMLLWNPAQLFDVGLQLSAVAVASIIAALRLFAYGGTMYRRLWLTRTLLAPRVRRIENRFPLLCRVAFSPFVRRVARGLTLLLGISVVATFATLPLVAHYFGRVSVVGIVASCVAVPVAYIVIFGAVALIVVPPLRGLTAAVITWSIDALHSAMAALTRLPFALVEADLSWWGVAALYALFLWLAHSLFVRTLATDAMERRRRRRAYAFRTIATATLILIFIVGGEMLLTTLRRPPVQMVVYNRHSGHEIHLVTPTTDSIATAGSSHMVGNVVLFAGRSVAIVDRRLPRVADVAMPPPLTVDVLLVSRGAKGQLADMLLRYSPQLLALDGSLSTYYRERYAAEAAAAGLAVYDISEEGALVLEAAKDTKN